MSPGEIRFLRHEIDTMGYPQFTEYAEKRMSERNITYEQALKTMYLGKIIEVHNNDERNIRVVLRHEQEKVGICIVVDLFKKLIITVYKNEKEDEHLTLNWSQYEWYVDIVQFVNNMKKEYISIKYGK